MSSPNHVAIRHGRRHPHAALGHAVPPVPLPRPEFRRDIEGVRGIAIVLVVLYHAGVPGFSGGYVGVDVFFVLSGYLITWLLVREGEATGGVDLMRFYARRVRRLLPALALVLLPIIVFGFLLYAPLEQRDLALSGVATALYASNVFFALGATDYLGADAETNPLLHTWSLSVEEQFYLVWPLLIVTGLRSSRGRSDRRRLLALVAGISGVSFASCLWLTSTDQPWAFFSAPTRAWEFGIGALAVLYRPQTKAVEAADPSAGAPVLMGAVGLLAIGVAAITYSGRTVFPGAAALLPAVGTALVLRSRSAEGESVIGRLLGVRALQETGRLSYSWYLWHWPILVLAQAAFGDLSLTVRIGLLLGSLVAAEASYRWVENPIRHHQWLSARSRRSIGFAFALTLAGVMAGFGWHHGAAVASRSGVQAGLTAARSDLTTLYEDGCIAKYPDTEPITCSYGTPAADRTMVLFGDSHAAQWAPAIDQIARERGYRFVPIIKTACPPADVAFSYYALGREYHECVLWRQRAFERIAALQPAVVFSTGSVAYDVDETDWREGTERTLAALGRAADIVLHIRDTPRPGFHVPACIARDSWRSWMTPKGCSFPRETAIAPERFAAELAAAAEVPNVYVVDLTQAICPAESCPVRSDTVVIYRDSNHLTASFAASLAPLLMDRLAASFAEDRSLRGTPVTSANSD